MKGNESSRSFEIKNYRGKPVVMEGGMPAPAYCYNLCYDLDAPGSKEILNKFADNGCRVFMLPVRGGVDGEWEKTAFWTGDGEFPEITPDEASEVSPADMANFVLDIVPDGRLWVRFTSRPPSDFRENHPDDMLLNSYGKRYREPSLASEAYGEQMRQFVENVVSFCESRPWGERVIGYLSYPIGEGTTPLTCEGFLFDQSPVMQRAYRDFLRDKYGADEELQAAWGRGDVTLETAGLPADQQWRERGETEYDKIGNLGGRDTETAHRLHWPEPEEMTAEKDYCRCMRRLTERNFQNVLGAIKKTAPGKLAGLDAFKQTMLGWPLMARSRGDYQTHSGSMHAVSGAWGMAELLDMPELDVVATPHDYLNRGMGFGYEGEGIGDSVVIRNKLMFMEEDQRTFCLSEGGKWNYLKNAEEVEAGFWRNLGASISRGYNTYPMDVCGPSFFDDDLIQEVLAERAKVHEASVHWERHEVPSVVMVVDDTSVLEEDLTARYQYLSVIHQRLYGLSRCGVPFRIHLFEDLARDNFPDCHRLFLFPNLFRLTPERIGLLRKKVLRDGNVAVFGPATGITDGSSLTAEAASRLTGIPMKLVRKESPRFVTIDRFDHPLTKNLGRRVDYGDSDPYGPLLVPGEAENCRNLGGIQWPSAEDGPGLVVREFGRGAIGNDAPGERGEEDYSVVFSCAVPLPAVLLRELARYSGTHIYCEENALVFVDSASLTIHSIRPGKLTVSLPETCKVWNVCDREQIGASVAELKLHIEPPQTQVFHLE
ncbi:MAG: hypothetical protein KGZ25_13070 [Planctomycetes bacterium]|nr:hypothetical protein [Planctomycetota bacterium]